MNLIYLAFLFLVLFSQEFLISKVDILIFTNFFFAYNIENNSKLLINKNT